MTEELLWLWINNIVDVGNITVLRLLAKLGSIENVYEASEDLYEGVASTTQIKNIMRSKKSSLINEMSHQLKEKNISIIYPTHNNYPDKLLKIYSPPTILYVRGKIKDSIKSTNMNIGIVGSRIATAYGRELAKSFGYELAKRGINIISGLALGIDGAAHLGALTANGYTIGVLGCGIDVVYPRENIEIYTEILNKGAIISEYGPGVMPSPGTFPMRNRIISGLSDGILVVEAKKKSGSLITADLAIEQGKQVYAIPGKLKDGNSEGTNNLIKNGAFLVTSYEDIMYDLTREEKYIKTYKSNVMEGIESMTEKREKNIFLAPIEKIVYSCLSLEPTYIDDIIQTTGMGITKTISVLYNMEEKGIIKQPVRGYYIISV